MLEVSLMGEALAQPLGLKEGGWAWGWGSSHRRPKGEEMWHLSGNPPWGSQAVLWGRGETRLQVRWGPGQATVMLRPWKMTWSDLQVATPGLCDGKIRGEEKWRQGGSSLVA